MSHDILFLPETFSLLSIINNLFIYNVDLLFLQVDKNTIKVEKWFGKSKEIAAVRTVCSHIENLFKGVMKVNYILTKL